MMIDRAVIDQISESNGDLWLHFVFSNGAVVVASRRHLVNVFDWQDGWPHYKEIGDAVRKGDLVDVMASDVFGPDTIEVVAFAGNRTETRYWGLDDALATDTFRLGVVELSVLPDQIVVRRTAATTNMPTLRAGTPIRVGKGQTIIQIEVQVIFTDAEELNSFHNGLRGIIAEFRRAPFLPVENAYLNRIHGVQAVALADIQLETVSGIPGAVLARLVLLPFNHLFFMPHVDDFASVLNKPLLTWYLRRGLIDPKNDGSTTASDPLLKPVPPDWTDPRHNKLNIEIMVPDQDLVDQYVHPDARIFHEAMDAVDALEKEPSGMRSGDGWLVLKREGGIKTFQGLRYTTVVFMWGIRDETLRGIGHKYDKDFTTLPDYAPGFVETYGQPDVILARGGYAGEGWSAISQRAIDRFKTKFAEARGRIGQSIEPPFEPFDFTRPDDLIVTGITAGHENFFATLHPESSEWPVFQFLGQRELRCKVELEVCSEEALADLVRLFETVQAMIRTTPSALSPGVMRLKNPITELLGMKYVILDTMNVRQKPRFPGHYEAQLIFVDFDILQVTRERTHTITKRADRYVLYVGDTPVDPEDLPPGYVVRNSMDAATEVLRVVDVMRTISAYPDLDLPTWDELIEAFGGIPELVPPNVGAEGDDYRSGEFVDPDFYFRFDPVTAEAQVKSWILRRMVGKRDLRFLLIDNEERISRTFGSDIVVEPQETAIYDEQARNQNDDSPEPRNLHDFKGLKDYVHDAMVYSGAGRMIRAFPTFSMWLVDEGRWIWWARTWDNFYSLGAVSSIEINRSRKRPADSCIITLSNIYGYLTDEDNTETDPTLVIKRTEWWRQLIPEFFNLNDEQMRELRSKPRNELPIGPGARMHIRMGYGGNVAALPIVFNGTVTEFHPGPVATLVGTGDGHELTHKILADPYKTSKTLSQSRDPRHSIIRLMLMPGDRDAQLAWLEGKVERLSDIFHRAPKGPVQHFGSASRYTQPYPEYPYTGGELGQNVYSPTKKKTGEPVMWFELWGILGEDQRVELMLHNKTIWDLIRDYQLTQPNFVAAVHPFEFRSTLFFGRPQWDIEYGYDFLPVPKNFPRRGNRTLSITDVFPDLKDTEGWYNYKNKYFIRAKKKPFSQWHIVSSFEDILANNIQVSSQYLIHNVVATYLWDQDLVTTYTRGPNQREVYARADEKIYPQFQRWEIVNTNIYITNDNPIASWWQRLFDAWKNWRHRDVMAFNYAASVIRESMEEMYQGYLTIVGDASIKPYDIIYLGDYFNQMYGGIGVRSVTHHMSLDTGFVTNIEPDALVSNKDPERHNLWSWFGTLSLAVLTDHVLASTYHRILTGFGSRLLASASKDPALTLAGRTFWPMLRTAARFALSALRRRAAFAAGTVLMGTAGASSSVVALAALPVMIFAFDSVKHLINRYFNGKDCVTMALLTYKGREYSAGIWGHKDSVVVRPDFSDALQNISEEERQMLKDPNVLDYYQTPTDEDVASVRNVVEGLIVQLKDDLADVRSYAVSQGRTDFLQSVAYLESLVDRLRDDVAAYIAASYPTTGYREMDASTARRQLAYTVYQIIAEIDDWRFRRTDELASPELRERLAERESQIQQAVERLHRAVETARGTTDTRRQSREFQLARGNRRIVPKLPEPKRILIDPGHGGSDPGTSGFGLVEKDLNLAVARKVAELLTEVGYQVALTRSGDTAMSLADRVQMAVKMVPDVFLSIHHNAANNSSARGSEVFVHSTARLTRRLGEIVLRNMSDELGTRSRRVDAGDQYYVIREPMKDPRMLNTHVLLAELLFLSNESDANIAKGQSYVETAAKALANGIIEFFTTHKRYFDDWVVEQAPSVSPDLLSLAKTEISRKALSLLGVVYKPDGTHPDVGFSSGSFVTYVLREAMGVRLKESLKPREILASGIGREVADPVEDDLIFIAVGSSDADRVNLAGFVLDPNKKLFIACVGPDEPGKVDVLKWDDPMFKDSYVTFRRITWLTSAS